MIKVGENPEGTPGLNKFIAKSGDGLRGRILALSGDGRRAVVLSAGSSLANDVQWGKIYLVEEGDPKNYPKVVDEVGSLPLSIVGPDWRLIW